MLSLAEIFTTAFANLISGLVANIVYIVIAIWGFRLIAKEIKEGVKNIPSWINRWDEIKTKHYAIERARGIK